jgi:nitroreductase/NAD-dependent dihydropyrimidine dehydrogenase PreA subunit
MISVDKEKCNRDGLCVAECPAQVLEIIKDGDFPTPTVDFNATCLKCGHCVAVCPTGAFSLEWLPSEACPPIQRDLDLTPEQAEQFLRSRRSIRIFKDDPVPREKLSKLIQIACYAPSAKNYQPWHWIVVENPAQVAKLDDMIVNWMKSRIRSEPELAERLKLPRTVMLWERGQYKALRNAPHLFIVHVERSWAYGVEDTALSLSYVELFARTLGLGATWSGYFYTAYNNYAPLAEAVPIPEDHKVVGAMMIGKPKFKYQRLPRRNEPRVEWR